MREIDLDKDFPRGKHAFIHDNLKIFFAYPLEDDDNVYSVRWGDALGSPSLYEATVIQNYAAMHGLAPRVYELVRVWFLRQWYSAQVVELVHGVEDTDMKTARRVYDLVKKLGDMYGFVVLKDDVSTHDVMDGKLVDFGSFMFSKGRMDRIKQLYIDKARYGNVYYHNVPEWDLRGSPRKNEDRINYLALDKISFLRRSVLDLGCAGGFFCRDAKDRGAAAVIGVDQGGHGSIDPIGAARIVSNELGYWDISYKNLDIREVSKNLNGLRFYKDFESDIVFFLSMNYHVGIPKWLPEVTKKVCIFEDNSKERNAKPTLEKMFRMVQLVGHSKDHGDKPVYHCWK